MFELKKLMFQPVAPRKESVASDSRGIPNNYFSYKFIPSAVAAFSPEESKDMADRQLVYPERSRRVGTNGLFNLLFLTFILNLYGEGKRTNILYTPWRNNYVNEAYNKSNKVNKSKQHQCKFCRQLEENFDEKNLILKRFKHCAIFLNLFPYSLGHILIMPYKHLKDLHTIKKEELHELTEACSIATKLLEKELKCHGFNVGINIGKNAGGSLTDHIHFHVVPRWHNDTNFLMAIENTRIISFSLQETYKKLFKLFKDIKL